MATFLRPLSYQYPWLYNAISRTAALSVGGEARFRQLALAGIEIQPDTPVLDLCCGSGQTTQVLAARSQQVIGLDASPRALERARQAVPAATFVEGWAEAMPLADDQFEVVHTSAALHEMTSEQLQAIIKEVYRVLKPGGYFVLVDFHSPENPVFWPGLAVFLWLFETDTAWQFIQTPLSQLLTAQGFTVQTAKLYAGGSLQVIQAQKPSIA
jgi:demethylmenaquinone methyltransferase/2-methoxy-6-polyprenyl-1,4-benzoquinol methylase